MVLLLGPPPDGGTRPRAEEYPACSRRFALGARPRLSGPAATTSRPRPLLGTAHATARARETQSNARTCSGVACPGGEARLPADTHARPIARAVRATHTPGNRGPKEAAMSTLVAIAYPDAATAERVRAELVQATKEHLVQLEDAVVVEHQPDGKIKLHQAMSTTGAGAAGGALWGGLIGLLFLAPLFGMAIGAATGAVAGKMTDVGVNDDLMKQIGAKTPPGGAVLIMLGSSGAREKVIDRVKSYGGEIIQTSLSEDDEAQLRAALGEPVSS